jgi:hypothetical protein
MSENKKNILKNGALGAAITLLIATAGHITGIWKFERERSDSYATLYKNELLSHAKTGQELTQLKAALATLNGNIVTLPFPFFIKDRDYRIVYINDAYEDQILRPLGIDKLEFIGTDGSLFGDEIKAEYAKNDEIVFRTGRQLKAIECIPTSDGDICGLSWKFPIYKNDYAYLIGGIWIPEYPELILKIN